MRFHLGLFPAKSQSINSRESDALDDTRNFSFLLPNEWRILGRQKN